MHIQGIFFLFFRVFMFVFLFVSFFCLWSVNSKSKNKEDQWRPMTWVTKPFKTRSLRGELWSPIFSINPKIYKDRLRKKFIWNCILAMYFSIPWLLIRNMEMFQLWLWLGHYAPGYQFLTDIFVYIFVYIFVRFSVLSFVCRFTSKTVECFVSLRKCVIKTD